MTLSLGAGSSASWSCVLFIAVGAKFDCLRGEESPGGPGYFRGWKLWGHYQEVLHIQRRYEAAVFVAIAAESDAVRDVKRFRCVDVLDHDDISNRVDFIICLGGDGTLLYASSLFQVTGSRHSERNKVCCPLSPRSPVCFPPGERPACDGLSPGLSGLPDPL